ncbi:MAG: sigma-70 family RNA polymerase sigma factor [Oscillospiraceae bacterium]|nr:sigma-70 family RNA polymerase sigma factor [Oscillospiraceae bacterium]
MLACCMIMLDNDDVDLFEQLYIDNRQMAFHIANRILHNDMLAEDAVSEAFFRIVEIFPKIHHLNSHKMQYYVVITVRNVSLNMLKREQSHNSTISIDEITNHQSSDTIDVESIHLRDCIAALSATDREILYFRANMGLGFREIGVTLGISSAAARQRYRHAKLNLKKLLEEGECDYE